MKNPRKLLITILTGNTIVNVAIASLATILALDIAAEKGINVKIAILYEVIIVTVIVLVFSEVAPKLAAVKRAESIAKIISIPLSVIHLILNPIGKILYGFTDFILRITGIEKKRINLSEEEVKTLVDVGEEKGTLEKEEHQMLHSIIELSETMVREIMVPRTDVTMISIDDSVDRAIEIVRGNKFSRFPVYGKSVDDIEGLLFAKDLIPYLSKNNNKLLIAELIKPVFYVPETKMVDELLREFQDKRKKLALVVDEYGGISGLVTLEDILEEIVGEIQDEHDEEEPIFRKISTYKLNADARWDLDDVEEEIGISFPEGEGYDSLGGFLFHQFGEIPEEDQEIIYKGVSFKVLNIETNRIIRVEIDSTNKESEKES